MTSSPAPGSQPPEPPPEGATSGKPGFAAPPPPAGTAAGGPATAGTATGGAVQGERATSGTATGSSSSAGTRTSGPPAASPAGAAQSAASQPVPASGGAFAALENFFALRREIPAWEALCLGLLSLGVCLAVWLLLTSGPGEERIVGPLVLPSPAETLRALPELLFGPVAAPAFDDEPATSPTWSEYWRGLFSPDALVGNLWVSLRRLLLGFGLAAAVGVPLGVLCGCFTRVNAFFTPLAVFGRNIPLAALVGLTFSAFGIGELQKVMFIFLACVAFVLTDTAQSIRQVGEQYVDTAYTLGARGWQVIFKVLVPLALPRVCDSLRLLFGLAFGYIMLAETIRFGNEAGGLGNVINMAMRRGPRENVFLVLLLIPVVALVIDRVLQALQRSLFPHVFGGSGWLHAALTRVLHLGEDLWCSVTRRSGAAPATTVATATASATPYNPGAQSNDSPSPGSQARQGGRS